MAKWMPALIAIVGLAWLALANDNSALAGALAGGLGIFLAPLLLGLGRQPRRPIEQPVHVGPFTIHHSLLSDRDFGQVRVLTSGSEVIRVPVFDRRFGRETASVEGEDVSIRTWTYRRQWWRRSNGNALMVVRRTGIAGFPSMVFRFDGVEVTIPYCHDCPAQRLLEIGWSAAQASDASSTQSATILAFLAAEQYRAIWPARWRTSETAASIGRA